MYYFFLVEVKADKHPGKVTLNQGGCNKKVLKTVGMLDSNNKINPSEILPLGKDADGPPFDEPWLYSSVVGMLMYISINYRPYLQFEVHQYFRFTHNPRKSHDDAVNMIFCYLVITQGQGLTLDPNNDTMLECYVDVYFVGLWKHEDDQYPVCVN